MPLRKPGVAPFQREFTRQMDNLIYHTEGLEKMQSMPEANGEKIQAAAKRVATLREEIHLFVRLREPGRYAQTLRSKVLQRAARAVIRAQSLSKNGSA